MVDEIYDEFVAKKMGIDQKGQVCAPWTHEDVVSPWLGMVTSAFTTCGGGLLSQLFSFNSDNIMFSHQSPLTC